ncbi:MAG TPA: YtxH domain-containing protein [Nitrospira sp.]|nr:YtxH domain-containing protein [Nitrospira sp.]
MNDQVRNIGFNGLLFTTGLIAGFGTGLLCAPRSGEETLVRLRRLADDAGDSAGLLIEDLKGAAGTMCEHTKRLVR